MCNLIISSIQLNKKNQIKHWKELNWYFSLKSLRKWRTCKCPKFLSIWIKLLIAKNDAKNEVKRRGFNCNYYAKGLFLLALAFWNTQWVFPLRSVPFQTRKPITLVPKTTIFLRMALYDLMLTRSGRGILACKTSRRSIDDFGSTRKRITLPSCRSVNSFLSPYSI